MKSTNITLNTRTANLRAQRRKHGLAMKLCNVCQVLLTMMLYSLTCTFAALQQLSLGSYWLISSKFYISVHLSLLDMNYFFSE